MDPLFEVRYYDNHKLISEFIRKFQMRVINILIVFMGVLFTLYLGISIETGMTGEKIYYLTVLGLTMVLLYFFPDWYAWQSMKRNKKMNDGVLPESVVTFADTIEFQEGMLRATVEYHKILRTVRLKHSYVLMFTKRNGVVIDPSKFTKGTFEEFKQFLWEKCPKITIAE